MKIYLAGNFVRREELSGYANLLTQDGHEITSSWLLPGKDHLDNGTDFLTDDPNEIRSWALRDVQDVVDSDVFVCFANDGHGRGGRHVEFGMAYTKGCAIYLVGERENVFHYLHSVHVVPDFTTLQKVLKNL